MLLAEIRQYLQQQQRLNMVQLVQRFKVDTKVLQDMLALLIRKGYVRVCLKTPRCGTQCNQCDVIVTEVYEWISQR